MHPGRVDVIGGGAMVLDRIMPRFGFAEVLVSEHDILDGIAWSLAAGRGPVMLERVPVTAGPWVAPGLPVPPGSGWPEDPATPATPVAADAGAGPRRSPPGVRATPGRADSPAVRLPGLPPAGRMAGGGGPGQAPSPRTQQYWGRPMPGWGRRPARILILGLAPAAHGGNRTGRIFTGDRSGDVLFASLYRCGLAARRTVHGGRRRAAPARTPGWSRRSAVRRRSTSPR